MTGSSGTASGMTGATAPGVPAADGVTDDGPTNDGPTNDGPTNGVDGVLDFRPAPGAAPRRQMLAAQASLELRLNLRHGESLLLTMIIPVGLLVFFSVVDVLPSGSLPAVDFLVPGVLALAVTSTAFTGQAIATGFERSYGVLKRLGASPLPRSVLLAGKTLSVTAIEVVQVALLVAIGFALGWNPDASAAGPAWVLLLVVLGTAAFSGLGLLMAGTLRAEATLAAANGVYLLLLLLGGVVFPVEELPGWLQAVSTALPTTALADGLRSVLTDAATPSWTALGVLAAWAVGTCTLAARFFRWE